MKQLMLLVQKDLRCLLRARQLVVSTAGFALLLVVVSSFALRQTGYGVRELNDLTPGILALVFLFCAVLGLNQSFSIEAETDALPALVASGVDPGALFFAKWLSNLVFLFFVQLAVLVVHGLLFGADVFPNFSSFALIGLLFGAGFTACGTLLSGISVSTQSREVILPLMLFPLSLPAVCASIYLYRDVFAGAGIATGSFWFLLLCGFDVISVTLSWLLFEHVVRG